MNNVLVQYAQGVVDTSHRSQYVDADCAVLGQCMAGADVAAGAADAWFIGLPTDIREPNG